MDLSVPLLRSSRAQSARKLLQDGASPAPDLTSVCVVLAAVWKLCEFVALRAARAAAVVDDVCLYIECACESSRQEQGLFVVICSPVSSSIHPRNCGHPSCQRSTQYLTVLMMTQDVHLQMLGHERSAQIRLHCEQLRDQAEEAREVAPDGSYTPMPGGGDWHHFVPQVQNPFIHSALYKHHLRKPKPWSCIPLVPMKPCARGHCRRSGSLSSSPTVSSQHPDCITEAGNNS